MAARKRNRHLEALFNEAKGYPQITKQVRSEDFKSLDLSGASYAQAEQETLDVWKRCRGRVFAGAPLAVFEVRPTGGSKWLNPPLTVSGKTIRKHSGIVLESENGQYVAYMNLQKANCANAPPALKTYSKKSGAFVNTENGQGGWLRLPIVKHTSRDEWQGPLLEQMLDWTVPIMKAALRVKAGKRQVMLLLNYSIPKAIPIAGERIAILGPIESDGSLHLRIEQMGDGRSYTQDYTPWLAKIQRTLAEWELTRRRIAARIGYGKGKSRAKKKKMAQWSPQDAITTWLDKGSSQMANWCHAQGVGRLNIVLTGGRLACFPFRRQIDQQSE